MTQEKTKNDLKSWLNSTLSSAFNSTVQSTLSKLPTNKADAINAIGLVTREQFDAGLESLRAEISALRSVNAKLQARVETLEARATSADAQEPTSQEQTHAAAASRVSKLGRKPAGFKSADPQ